MTVEITWLGTSCFRIVTETGIEIYFDPYLNRRQDYNPPPIRAEDIKKADAVIATHGHFEHFWDAPQIVKQTGAKLIASKEVIEYAVSKMGVPADQAVAINADESTTVGEVEVVATKARHRPTLEVLRFWFRDPQLTIKDRDHLIELWRKALEYEDIIEFGFNVPSGPLQGYVLTTEDGFRIWNVSETYPVEGLDVYSKKYRPQITLLSCMKDIEDETMEVLRAVRPRLTIIYQFDMFHPKAPYYTSLAELWQRILKQAYEEIPGIEVIVPVPGRPYRFDITWK